MSLSFTPTLKIKKQLKRVIAKKFLISGQVQGVFFRKTTESFVHKELPNIIGYVKNLSNGQVEVFAMGEEDQLIALKKFLRVGPKQSRVDRVEEEDVKPILSLNNFMIIRE